MKIVAMNRPTPAAPSHSRLSGEARSNTEDESARPMRSYRQYMADQMTVARSRSVASGTE